jgi:glycosyltransferase involved in cell wall biosynthesis
MKIAFVIGGLPFGGVESWLFDVAHKLRQMPGVEPVIINVSGTGVRHAEYLESGLTVFSAGDSKSCLNTHRLGTVCKLRKILKSVAPDIIHTLHFSGDYFGRLASIGMGIPVVTHIRNIKHERKTHRVWANKILSYRTDIYLCVSGEVVDTVQQDHNLAGRPVQVLYNAADLVKLDVPPHDLDAMGLGQGKTILALGRLVPQKNFSFLLRVFKRLENDLPESRLIILGEGSERPALEREIEELRLTGRAFLPGYQKDAPRWLQASDLFVMPSLFEGFPISHIEAMGCGLPSIISEYVPSKEAAGEAALVLPLDEAVFADAIKRLLTEENLYHTMRLAALAKAQEFNIDAYLERLLTVYSSLSRTGC